jgi:hypothetical protein
MDYKISHANARHSTAVHNVMVAASNGQVMQSLGESPAFRAFHE